MFSWLTPKLALPVMVGLLFIGVYFYGYSKGKEAVRYAQLQADTKRVNESLVKLDKVEKSYDEIFRDIQRDQVDNGCDVPMVLRNTLDRLPSP